MKLVRLKINNFRGIKEAELYFNSDIVLVGDNNTGKSTILEAIDLVLGPERLIKHPVIDEHDFYAGLYLTSENMPVDITVEATIIDLNFDQQVHFRNHLEWWDSSNKRLIDSPPAQQTDQETVSPALRLGFRGYYDPEEDDFSGETYFLSPKLEEGSFERLGTRDKRMCGFLYLRTLRTGSRALSLERGSLLDIILKIKELRPQMWEGILDQLYGVSVASNPELGIIDILQSVQKAIRELVPVECADAPQIRVSQMTREHLRQILTVFLGTGSAKENGCEYAAPFHHQGTGTINTLVLALLSIIAELKQNVIFAMEEPEIAIPPHTQKRVINSVISKSAQSIFTSHSPYVLEEFSPDQIISIRRENGKLIGMPATYPPAVKPKTYRDEVKRRFCEALLARRVLIVEGRTEYDAIPAVANRLSELNPAIYSPLEALGIAVINAETDTQVRPLGEYFKSLGKTVYAIFDKQTEEVSTSINQNVDIAFEAPEMGFENVVINGSKISALKRFSQEIISAGDWPSHLVSIKPSEDTRDEELKQAFSKYFKGRKGEGVIADFLIQCSEDELPEHITKSLKRIVEHAAPPKIESTSEAANEDVTDNMGEG
jgi:putative ATP-dependent endonuclease of OLD family